MSFLTSFNNRNSAFSLLELMIVLGIIGVLTAIAVPAYIDYTQKSKVATAVQTVSAIKNTINAYQIKHGEMPNAEKLGAELRWKVTDEEIAVGNNYIDTITVEPHSTDSTKLKITVNLDFTIGNNKAKTFYYMVWEQDRYMHAKCGIWGKTGVDGDNTDDITSIGLLPTICDDDLETWFDDSGAGDGDGGGAPAPAPPTP